MSNVPVNTPPSVEQGGVLFAINPHQHGNECPRCDGTGTVPAGYDIEGCPRCYGTGVLGWCDSCCESIKPSLVLEDLPDDHRGVREIASVAPGGKVVTRIACMRDECLGTCVRWVLDEVHAVRAKQGGAK